MKRFLITLLVLAGLGGMVAASIGLDRKPAGTEVYVEDVTRREIVRQVKASGRIHPRVKVNISAHVVSRIEKLHVVEGQRVEQGAPFVDLERDAFLASRDTQSAALRMSKTDVQRAAIQVNEAQATLGRLEALARGQAASAEEVEAARRTLDSAKLDHRRAQQSVTQAQAGLEKAQDDLTKTTIYAPISGKVIALNAKEGEVVISGTMNNAASVIGTVADVSEMVAEVEVDETEVVYLERGQVAMIEVDALPNDLFKGEVVEIGSSGFQTAAQPDVTLFRVKVAITDPDPRLRPEMSTRVEIAVTRHGDAIVVPIQAVVKREPLAETANGTPGTTGARDEASPATDDEVNVVYVALDDHVQQRRVETDISDETHVEVVSGLRDDERVVTGPYRALKKLAHGDAIRVKERSDDDKRDDDGDKGEEAKD